MNEPEEGPAIGWTVLLWLWEGLGLVFTGVRLFLAMIVYALVVGAPLIILHFIVKFW